MSELILYVCLKSLRKSFVVIFVMTNHRCSSEVYGNRCTRGGGGSDSINSFPHFDHFELSVSFP